MEYVRNANLRTIDLPAGSKMKKGSPHFAESPVFNQNQIR
jgi:hypothetical protein